MIPHGVRRRARPQSSGLYRAPHFEYVAGSCSRGLADLSLQLDIPVAFGVLTVDTIEQAIERSGTKSGNKGADAALTAVEMVSLLRKL